MYGCTKEQDTEEEVHSHIYCNVNNEYIRIADSIFYE